MQLTDIHKLYFCDSIFGSNFIKISFDIKLADIQTTADILFYIANKLIKNKVLNAVNDSDRVKKKVMFTTLITYLLKHKINLCEDFLIFYYDNDLCNNDTFNRIIGGGDFGILMIQSLLKKLKADNTSLKINIDQYFYKVFSKKNGANYWSTEKYIYLSTYLKYADLISLNNPFNFFDNIFEGGACEGYLFLELSVLLSADVHLYKFFALESSIFENREAQGLKEQLLSCQSKQDLLGWYKYSLDKFKLNFKHYNNYKDSYYAAYRPLYKIITDRVLNE